MEVEEGQAQCVVLLQKKSIRDGGDNVCDSALGVSVDS